MRTIERFLLGLSLMIPGAVLAAAPTPGALPVKDPNSDSNATIGTIAVQVINFLLIAAGALAVIFLIVGGVRYLVSAGNSDQIEKAKHTIVYAIIGVVVIIFAYVIVNVISNTLAPGGLRP